MTRTFLQLIDRVKNAESGAIRLLVTDYGDVIRRELRFASLDRRLRQLVSDSDVAQSVWSTFFFELMAGRVFDAPEKLAEFLKVVTRAKVADAARFWTSQRRDVRRNRTLGESATVDHSASAAAPDLAMVNAELLKSAMEELSSLELSIIKWRQNGETWEAVAARLGEGTTADSVRKQHQRALSRIARRLNVTEGEVS